MHLLICGGTTCRSSESESIRNALEESLERNGLENEVKVVSTGCFGFCDKGPIVKVIPGNTFYIHVKPEDAEEIV